MNDRIPTLEELLNWSNKVCERRAGGEKISEIEYDAALKVFNFVVYELYKQNPLKIYRLLAEQDFRKDPPNE